MSHKAIAAAALLLSLALVFGLFAAACSDPTNNASAENGNTGDTAAAADTAETAADETTTLFMEDSLPSLDFGGEKITHLYREAMKDEFTADEMNGEVVNDAVFAKNLAVETRLNITIEYIPNPSMNWDGGYQSMISNSVLAGDEAYDIISGPSFHIPTLIIEGCLYNLNEIPYLDFDKPWWTQNLAETTAFGDKLFLVSGDISMGMIRYIHCLYFNQTVTDSYGIDELYDEVFDGSWTITRMNELCTGMYDDLNGNGSVDLNSDRFGYIITNENLWRAYIDSLDVNYLYISPKTGLPEFNFADPRSFEVCDFFTELLSAGNPDTRMGEGNESTYKIFTENRAAFVLGRFIDCETAYREMEDDFGILPMPKWEESQDGYEVTICGSESTFGVPVNSSKIDRIGAVMEALASESYRTVTPAYYESALKVKYTRDNTVSQIIDLIHSGAVFNPTVQMSKLLGSIDYYIIRTARSGGSLASTFASVESQKIAKLEEVLEKIS